MGNVSACEYVFSPDAADWGDLNYKDRGKRGVEEAASRDERQFQTKLFGDVEVVVKGKSAKPQSRNSATELHICNGASLKF